MEENSAWKIKDNRFVAFLDILGFKELVMRNSHDEVYQKMLKISDLSSHTKSYQGFEIETGTIEIVHFSDSIIFFSKNDNISNYSNFIAAVNAFYLYALKYEIPLKGSIAHGEIIINKDKNIYFGQPIIDAFLLQEDVNYLGIVAHHSIDIYLKEMQSGYSFGFPKEIIFEEKTPLKSGNVNHLNLNWFSLAAILLRFEKKNQLITEEEIEKHIEGIITNFKYTATGYPRKYIDNTIDFFRESLKNKNTPLFGSKLS